MTLFVPGTPEWARAVRNLGNDGLTLTYPIADFNAALDAPLTWHTPADHPMPDLLVADEDFDWDELTEEEAGQQDILASLTRPDLQKRQDEPSASRKPLTVFWTWINDGSGNSIYIRLFQYPAWFGNRGVGSFRAEHNDRWWTSVSLNPSRLRDPSGWSLCPLDEAQGYAFAVVLSLAEQGIVSPDCPHVQWLHDSANPLAALPPETSADLNLRRAGGRRDTSVRPPGGGDFMETGYCTDLDCLGVMVNVSRLHIAADIYGVREEWVWRDAIKGHRHHKPAVLDEYPNGVAARHGKSGFRVSFYNKTRERKHRHRAAPPPGTVRIEVQGRSPLLRRRMQPPAEAMLKALDYQLAGNPVRLLAGLTPEFAAELFFEGFVWVGLDRWVGQDRPLPRLQRPSQLMLDRIVEYLTGAALGAEPKVSPNTRRKYAELTARMGFILGVHPNTDLGPARILDLEAGVEARPSSDWQARHGYIENKGALRRLSRREMELSWLAGRRIVRDHKPRTVRWRRAA